MAASDTIIAAWHIHLHETVLAVLDSVLMKFSSLGRASREKENTQGSRQEEDHIHKAVRERYNDRWQEEGMSILSQPFRYIRLRL